MGAEPIERLKKAAADFDAAMELATEARETMKGILNDFREKDSEGKEAMFRAVGYDTLIAFWSFSMIRKAQSFPAKFATMLIMGEMAKEFGTLLAVNFAANMGRLKECAVHGPLCDGVTEKHDPEFPEIVDENLKPIEEVIH